MNSCTAMVAMALSSRVGGYFLCYEQTPSSRTATSKLLWIFSMGLDTMQLSWLLPLHLQEMLELCSTCLNLDAVVLPIPYRGQACFCAQGCDQQPQPLLGQR